jgi:hypothetical protein
MRQSRRELTRTRRDIAKMPKFWIPSLDSTQTLDAKVIHWDLISRFTDGTAHAGDLWAWIETGLTYSQVMRFLAEDGMEFTYEAQLAIAEQLGIYDDVIARYKSTGRIGFNGPQLNIARAAANVFDSLVELDRNGAAVRAATWSTEQMAKLQRSLRQ